MSTRGQGAGSRSSTSKGEAAEGLSSAGGGGPWSPGQQPFDCHRGGPGGALSAFVNILSPGPGTALGDIIVQNQPLEKPLISFFFWFCLELRTPNTEIGHRMA